MRLVEKIEKLKNLQYAFNLAETW